MVTIDQLLEVVAEFQNACRRAAMNQQWDLFAHHRAALKKWFEDNNLPITFPDEENPD